MKDSVEGELLNDSFRKATLNETFVWQNSNAIDDFVSNQSPELHPRVQMVARDLMMSPQSQHQHNNHSTMKMQQGDEWI